MPFPQEPKKWGSGGDFLQMGPKRGPKGPRQQSPNGGFGPGPKGLKLPLPHNLPKVTKDSAGPVLFWWAKSPPPDPPPLYRERERKEGGLPLPPPPSTLPLRDIGVWGLPPYSEGGPPIPLYTLFPFFRGLRPLIPYSRSYGTTK